MKEVTTQPLLGRIMYHISSQPPSSKKRARPWEEENGTTSLDASSIFRRGFIFVSEEEQQQRQEYSLVVPYQSLRIASHAASSGKLVHISQYSLLRYRNDWGEMLFSSGGVKKWKQKASATEQREDGNLVIEVFVDGLSLAASSGNADEEEKGEEIQAPVLTLEMLAQNEYQQLTKGKKKKSQDKQPIHVTGVVDAISPILVNDPQQEPFSIMELYQSPMTEEESTRTAVVIIRGERALSVHPAIHPGQTITLLSVVHRKWKVPDEFRKRASNEKQSNGTSLFERLCYRVPGRVIVVTEASNIKWNDGTSLKPNLSLPSTVESLTSIRGVVKSVHYRCVENKNGKADRILHFVTIKPLIVAEEIGSESSNELKLARIYLPKYAIPPNVSLGLQAESIIRAVNIHSIPPPIGDEKKCPFKHQASNDLSCYVACLRSTITIERCAGESNHRNRSSSNIWFVPTCNKSFLLVPDCRISDVCADLDLCHSKSSAQLVAEDRLICELRSNRCLAHGISSKAWSALMGYHYHIVDDYGQPVANCENVRCDCPTRKSKIIPVENETNGIQTIRDPYSEFFDHSHSDSHGDWIECGSCSSSFSCFNHHRQSMSETMPIVIDSPVVFESFLLFELIKGREVSPHERILDPTNHAPGAVLVPDPEGRRRWPGLHPGARERRN